MTQPRIRRVVALLTPVAFALAACGAQPQSGTGAAQTQPVEDTQTRLSDAAQAQIESPDAPVDAPLTGDAASQMLSQIAGIAGAMQAAARLCGPNVPDAQLGQARDQLRGEFTRMGGDAGTFDGEFASAHEATTARFTRTTPAQQKQMCDELEAMAAQTPPPPAS